MRTQHGRRIPGGRVVPGQHQHGTTGPGSQPHGGHGWMMIACCIPMLVIAIALVAAGVASPGFLVAAIGCTLMMAMMMRGMSRGGSDERP